MPEESSASGCKLRGLGGGCLSGKLASGDPNDEEDPGSARTGWDAGKTGGGPLSLTGLAAALLAPPTPITGKIPAAPASGATDRRRETVHALQPISACGRWEPLFSHLLT